MKRLVVSIIIAALATAASAGAQSKSAFVPQLQPTISGTVASATEHSVVVNTDGNETMSFEVDSRSVVPTELPAGTRVRVEFHLMESGKYHAARITPTRGGSAGDMSQPAGKMPAERAGALETPAGESVSAPASPPQAAETGPQAGSAVRAPAAPGAAGSVVGGESRQTTGESQTPASKHETQARSSETTPGSEIQPESQSSETKADKESYRPGDQELPHTRSPVALFGILGTIALGAGAALWLARRRRSA